MTVLIWLGAKNAGKTTLLHALKLVPEIVPTIGVHAIQHAAAEILDCSGDARYQSIVLDTIRKIHLRKRSAVFCVVYEAGNQASWEEAKAYVQLVAQNCQCGYNLCLVCFQQQGELQRVDTALDYAEMESVYFFQFHLHQTSTHTNFNRWVRYLLTQREANL